jgi:alpha-mannosidase
MRYTSVLDTDEFASATAAAARAAVAGDSERTQTELSRAFDLLADARNHVYAVDFYTVDLTLLAASTLGETLRAKLATGSPTSLLVTGELVEQIAREHPDTLAELRRATAAGTACLVGGMYQGRPPASASPEWLLAELDRGQQAARRHLERGFEVYAQFDSAFSPRLPEILHEMGFVGAVHAAFDGRPLPKADQCKTWWGREGASIRALSTTPLDASRPETWLRLAERIGDTIARDHVATILLAAWPGTACDYYGDLLRAARYGPVLGKLVTLEEYFRISSEPDAWTTFYPREYPASERADAEINPISSRVASYRDDVRHIYDSLAKGVAAAAGLTISDQVENETGRSITINPWNFARAQFMGADPLAVEDSSVVQGGTKALVLPNVPGCGYATPARGATAPAAPLAIEGTLRNERFELTVSETTGGIQSLRTHRDRSTRISQRLVFQDRVAAGSTQMVAERIEITRNDEVVGEITSHGQLLNAAGELLARFTQTMRLARAVPAVIVDVELDPQRWPSGDIWSSYFASRMAWSDDAVSFRRGVQWASLDAHGPHIASPEWVEVDDGIGTITCFGLGLAFHRQVGPTWLDTLLLVANEAQRRIQFALTIDEVDPLQTVLALLTAGRTYTAELPAPPHTPTGWFLHLGAKNVLVTHVEPLAPPQSGIRLRLLETAGRDTRTTLAAFRPFHAARTTDFRGQPTGVLSMADGRAEFDIGAQRWIQLEAEW